MKTLRLTTRIVAIVQLSLGIIHCAFTPKIMQNIPPDFSQIFLYMFIATGLAFIFIGLVMLHEQRKAIDGNYRIINISMALLTTLGLLGIITMSSNPFAWVSALFSLVGATVVFGVQLRNINPYKILLFSGSMLILLVAITHVYIALVGGELYIFFGAGEDMHQLDKAGSKKPMILTLLLALFFLSLSIYGMSGSGTIIKLPFLKYVLYCISALFVIRGLVILYELPKYLVTNDSNLVRFIFFSGYALVIGILYFVGTIKLNKQW